MAPRILEPSLSLNSPYPNEDEAEFEDILTDRTAESRRVLTQQAAVPASPTMELPNAKTLTPNLSYRPRTTSPFRKSHLRSKSSTISLSAPQMTRTRSLPNSDSGGRPMMATAVRPSSPLGPPGRRRSPLRRSFDEPYLSFGGQVDIGETISENQELDLTPRQNVDVDGISSPVSSIPNTFPRIRRRPSSPFYPPPQPAARTSTSTSTLRPSSSSPSLSSIQFNEPFPSSFSLSSPSFPSTPTSFRSRSPSISSLETIPDSPDAELEAESTAQVEAIAGCENDNEEQHSVRRRASSDAMGKGGAARDKRKRWSVCGAERRGDLDLETIWED